MTLPPFEADPICPKCGCTEVMTIFRETGKFCREPGVDWRSGEHLDRVCERCHYEWAEAVLSHADAAAGDREGAES